MLIKGKKTTKNKTVKEYTVSKEELNVCLRILG